MILPEYDSVLWKVDSRSPSIFSSMNRILAISNQKGGVAKTTTALNISGALVLQGYKVLLVDLDPQANATTALGYIPYELNTSISEVLLGQIPIHAAAIIHHSLPLLHVIPANDLLIELPHHLHVTPKHHFILRTIVEAQSSDLSYDYIIFDCPPAMNILTINALCAAHDVIIPLQTEFFALEGLRALLQSIYHIKNNLSERLEILGILLTMVGKNTLCQEICAQTHHHFPNLTFGAEIPRSVTIPEAQSHGQVVQQYAPKSRCSQAYNRLSTEVLFRTGRIASLPSKETSFIWQNPNLEEA